MFKPILASAVTSAGSASVSFFVATLPVLQWLAAFVAFVSGVIAIMMGVLKIRDWWHKRGM